MTANITKGGNAGVEQRDDDGCPICDNSYQYFVPLATDGMFVDDSVERICTQPTGGKWEPGTYVHYSQ